MTETDSNPKAPLDKSTIVSSPVNDRSAAGGPRWRIVATLNTWLGRFYREFRKDQPREQIAQLYYGLRCNQIATSASRKRSSSATSQRSSSSTARSRRLPS